MLRNPFKTKGSQLELALPREREPDRNFSKGGRSFYFFDFDDNVAFLSTPIFLFHRDTKEPLQISSQELAKHSAIIGKSGIYADHFIDSDPVVGSFRAFRDKDIGWLKKRLGHKQIFVEDLARSLGLAEGQWKGPSWGCFYHAVFNARPLALITARGHAPKTIRDGIKLWVKEGHIPQEPNYLDIYPVSYPETKRALAMSESDSIPHLKQKALRAAVFKAIAKYGNNPHHRFGMSDDDPRNVEWIAKEMRELKRELPSMSFFIISTHGEQMQKLEIFADRNEEKLIAVDKQMALFEE